MHEESLFQPRRRGEWQEIRRHYAIHYDYYEMAPHSHPEWEWMYIAGGGCKVFYGEPGREAAVPLREGQCVFLDAMVPHRLFVARGAPCRVLNLEVGYRPARSGLTLAGLAGSADTAGAFFAEAPACCAVRDDGALHGLFQSALALQRAGAPGMQAQCDLLLGALLLEFARQWRTHRPATAGDLHVRRALLYLDEHFDGDVTVAAAAAAVGVSPAHLQRLFKAETGCTMLEYLFSRRVEKARLLLEASTLPLIDVAVSVGFHNRQHFSAVFTRLTGVSPGRYRLLHGGNRAPAAQGWPPADGAAGNDFM
jgi:AraC-like DNA-binding protein